MHKQRIIKSILLLAGAFTFAFLLGEMVHDSGHYLCHLAHGNTQVQVHFDPFGGTHISGANNLPAKVLGVTSVAGPLSNLILGLVSFVLLWRIRCSTFLPLLLWGPVAMIQEGVTFSLGLLTPGGDAKWISGLEVPQIVILLFGIVLLITGIIGVALLLPLVGIGVDDPPRYKFAIIVVSMCSLMLVRLTYSMLATLESTMENLIPLVFSLLLAASVVLVHEPITRILSKITVTESASVPWLASLIAVALGASLLAVQALYLG